MNNNRSTFLLQYSVIFDRIINARKISYFLLGKLYPIVSHLQKCGLLFYTMGYEILSRSKSPQFSSHGLLPVRFLFGMKKEENMFEKSGEKIKKLSNTIFGLNVVIVLIVLFFLNHMSNGFLVIPALLVAGLILVHSWMSQLLLYGFGDLVDSNAQIAELLQEKRINPLIELLKLYEARILTKEEFNIQKNALIKRDLNNIAELINIRNAYEKGLLSEEEYTEIKNDAFIGLTQQNETATYKVIFKDVQKESLKIVAPKNATKKELVKIVKKMGYGEEIDDIIKKS